jgi:hypothetical protein
VFPEVKLTWSNPQSQYHLLVVKNIEASPVSTGLFPTGANKPSDKELRNKPTQSDNYEVRVPTLEYWGNYDMVLYRISASPSTNVKNGLGIFTGISGDTLRLYVRK